jgi:hypothetical protein
MTSKSPNGFALLMTLIVITIVLAIGLTILNITTKQLALSSLARESEVALFGASAGLECMQYHLNNTGARELFLNLDDDQSDTSAPNLACAGNLPRETSTNHVFLTSPSRTIFQYNYTYDLGTDRCSEVSLFFMDLSEASRPLTVEVNQGLDELDCGDGNICSTIFARGFNRPCTERDALFSVQRELTLEL